MKATSTRHRPPAFIPLGIILAFGWWIAAVAWAPKIVVGLTFIAIVVVVVLTWALTKWGDMPVGDVQEDLGPGPVLDHRGDVTVLRSIDGGAA